MATTRHGKSTLVEYLGRARDEERRIETALAAHLVMVGRPSYQKRLERHLEATKLRVTELEKQIKRLGGTVSRSAPGGNTTEVRKAAKRVTDRAVELAEGSVEKLRHDAEASKLLDNARAEYADATAQVGNYSVVRALAKAAGDKNAGRLAKTFRAEHEDLAEYVRKLIPKLSKAAVEAEASKPASPSRARSSTRSTRSRSASAKRTTAASTKRSTTGRARSAAKRTTPASASSPAKRTRSSAKRATSASASSPAKRTTTRAASGAKRSTARASSTKRTTSRAATGTKRAASTAKRASDAKS